MFCAWIPDLINQRTKILNVEVSLREIYGLVYRILNSFRKSGYKGKNPGMPFDL